MAEREDSDRGEVESPAGIITGEEVTPDKDDTLAWILKGLGRESNAAGRRRAGQEAGDDAGQWFYQLFFSECSLSVRADCLTAYVGSVSKLASLPKLAELIGSTRLKDPVELTVQQVRESLMVEPPTWVKLCCGRAAVPVGAPDYCIPGDPDTVLPAENLEGWSKSRQDLIESEGLDEDRVVHTRALATMPQDVIGTVGPVGEGKDGVDVFGRPLPAKGLQGRPTLGAHVTERDGQLIAQEYGYVYLLDGKLSIASPIWLEDDNSRAYWFVLDRRPRPITATLVQRWLDELGVVEGVDPSAIETTVAQINDGAPSSGMHVIAQGLAAENGEDAVLEVLVQTAPRYGVLRDDGSIDLTKSRFDPNVRVDQEVARLAPSTKGSPGCDLMGNPIPGRDGKALQVKCGAGVRVEDGVRGFQHFYAERVGALKSVLGEVAVTDTLVIDSDVGFDTGNLEYPGEVVIKGGVGQGFTVKAGSNGFVFGAVDAGATIVAGGDVVIGQGIAGRRTRVVARGQVRTGYIHEARVRAGGDILVGNHIFQGILHADGVVSVEEREGPRGGSISGGEVWGLSGIRLHVAAHRNTTAPA